MDVMLQMAIDLACQLKEDERALAVRQAQANADADEDLQALIGDFNLKRIAINEEETKEERDADKLRQLNTEIREIYAKVMANEHMVAYNEAKTSLDQLMGKIQTALNLAVQGQDPNLAAQEISCSGNCGTCGGCH